MNNRSDIDRALRVWMSDGPAVIPDRVVDVVAARIGVQPQRRTWPFPRRTNVTPIKLIGGLAAALVVAVVGYNLLPRQTSNVGGSPQPSATATPSTIPTSTPAATAPTDLPEGTLTGGRYRMDLSFIDPGLSVAADVPAGWEGLPEFAALSKGGVLLTFMEAASVYSDACHWDLDGTGDPEQPGDVEVGPSVEDLVAALKANTSYTSSAAAPVTFGEFEGQELELQLPGDDVQRTCDEHGPTSPFDGPAFLVFGDGGWYAQGPNSRWQLSIVDVDGTRVITMVSILEGTPQADIAAAEAIVASFEFTP